MPTAAYYKKHKKRLLKKLREKYAENPEYYRNRAKQWRLSNPDKYRDGQLRIKFNISLDDYKKLLTKQKGKCIICGSIDKDRDLAVDHCHKTGKIRGLLCSACNVGLGKFKDNVKLLNKAIKYLRSYK